MPSFYLLPDFSGILSFLIFLCSHPISSMNDGCRLRPDRWAVIVPAYCLYYQKLFSPFPILSELCATMSQSCLYWQATKKSISKSMPLLSTIHIFIFISVHFKHVKFLFYPKPELTFHVRLHIKSVFLVKVRQFLISLVPGNIELIT